ncbi:hypothetical protein Nepgr_012583 [Nepenthes gracilis]|uniref:Glycosyl transferase 64 domain-containing protein n=1 Tax=Nepenthes gracilis TaxID=150966 RepID=A0AAD3SHJ2_NEPGR|nr:hypothetical protein Nepgr_012583 [Nepenthes gracilis]
MEVRSHLRSILFTLLCISLVAPLSVFSHRSLGSNPCDRKTLPDPQSLRFDQLTVLINGYSESRIPLLHSIAATYAASSLVSSILVLWGNPSTSSQTLAELSRNLSILYSAGASITVHPQKSSSLNSRFLPRPSIKTRAVLICDDDIEVDPKSVDFAFRVWQSNPDRLVGFFARSHDLDLPRKTWIYTVHPDKYSIILTKFMILKNERLYSYSCGGGGSWERMRNVVEEMRNCEDILMNFVVADATGEGPTMVAAERVRDWGDPRNEGGERGEETKAGLSSVNRGGGEHRKRRGDCIREFHRILGRMPLRYSYGKVVNSVGEQGMCEKGGKLVLCDHQPLN